MIRKKFTADLVCLSISLPDKDAINVWCAVVDKASDDLILSADTVQRLTQSKIYAVTTRSANADTRIDDDDDDGDVNDVKFTLIPVNVGLLQIIT